MRKIWSLNSGGIMKKIINKVIAAFLAVIVLGVSLGCEVKAESFISVVLTHNGTNYTREIYSIEAEQIKAGLDTDSVMWVTDCCNYVNFITNGAIILDPTEPTKILKDAVKAGKTSVTIDLGAYTQEAMAQKKLADAIQLMNGNAAVASNVTDNAAVPAVPSAPKSIILPPNLGEIGINAKLSECTTKYNEREDRAQNVRTAASRINGLILQPGQGVSFDAIILPRTVENGYGYGNVINGGTYVKAIGGGICQVSSTLNNAVLRAGIIPFERHNHSHKVGYLPAGLDATVSHGTYDYQFINTLQYPIYIAASANGGVLTVAVYGNAAATGGITYTTEVVGSAKSNSTYLVGRLNGIEVSRVKAYSSSYK